MSSQDRFLLPRLSGHHLKSPSDPGLVLDDETTSVVPRESPVAGQARVWATPAGSLGHMRLSSDEKQAHDARLGSTNRCLSDSLSCRRRCGPGQRYEQAVTSDGPQREDANEHRLRRWTARDLPTSGEHKLEPSRGPCAAERVDARSLAQCEPTAFTRWSCAQAGGNGTPGRRAVTRVLLRFCVLRLGSLSRRSCDCRPP